jgi:hypothetical protein
LPGLFAIYTGGSSTFSKSASLKQEDIMLHGHVQIEYRKPGSDFADIESLDGIDPRSPESRAFVHVMLDEYLDVLAARMTLIEAKPEAVEENRGRCKDSYHWDEAGFRIFPDIDKH